MKDKQEFEIPVYPHRLIRDLKEEDKPYPYDGLLNDLNARKNYKLTQIWMAFSDLRKNQRLCKLLERDNDDDDEKRELKYVLIAFMDRIGRVLSATNLFEEINQ